MSMLTISALLGMLTFGILAIIFSFHEERLKKELHRQADVQKRRVYEISVLKSIQDRIGYSLDIEHIIDTLTGSLKNLFLYSTVSSLIIKENEIVIKTVLEERVGTNFLNQVQKSMLASIGSLVETPLPQHREEIRTGLVTDDTNTQPLASFFHIPLIVSGQPVGLISICSTTPGLYKDEDMTILYQITATASNALSRLRSVIATEQQKLIAMITSLTDGIIMIDQSYKLTFMNDSAKTLLGIPHLANPTVFDVVNMLSKHNNFEDKIKEALSKNTMTEKEELNLGDTVMEVTITPVTTHQDEQEIISHAVMGVTILLHDITLEKGLEHMKEDFTNEVVHELRSPLTAIKAASEMMILHTDLPQSDKKLAAIIEQQSKRMLNDINSLLDAAQMEAGHFTIWPAKNDIVQIVAQTIDLFQPEAQKKGISLQLHAQDTLPKAFIDTTRIAQVLNNLLSNSLKFTSQGGTITISLTGQYNAELPQTKTNPGILVSVNDTGIGIPPDKQNQLFKKFAQIHTDTIGMHGGTGLGLYIVKGIVEAHGGNIYVNSLPSKGTTIFFTLPVANEEEKPLLNPTLQAVFERYTPKILN